MTRRTATSLLLGLLALAIRVPAVASAPAALSLRRLTGPLYLVIDSDYDATNSLVYIGTESVTVVGATWTPDTARALARQIGRVTTRPVTAVIDTSPDPEWSGGNAYWKSVGAKIFAVSATDDLLERTWSERNVRASRNHPGYPSLPLAAPTDVFADHFQLQNGDLRAFYLGPSHTRGDIFVYFPRERVLDAGSILKPHLGNLADADLAAYPVTLHRLQGMHLKIRTIIAGHWSAVHGPGLIDQYLRMLQQRGPRVGPHSGR